MSEIIIVAGSNNKNMELAREFEKSFKEKNIAAKIVDLTQLDLPLYTPVEESKGIPEGIREYVELFDRAKGFVFAAPEYNGGVPPVVTNTIAWISRSDSDWRKCFNGKPAAIASFSGGGGSQLLMALRLQLSYLGLNVLGRQVQASGRQPLDLVNLKAVANLLAEGVKA